MEVRLVGYQRIFSKAPQFVNIIRMNEDKLTGGCNVCQTSTPET